VALVSARDADLGSTYRSLLEKKLQEQGFFSWGFLDKVSLEATIRASGTDPETMRRYGIDETESVAVVALRYGEGEYDMPSWAEASCPGPGGTAFVELARFARANWYGEILLRLKAAVSGLVGAASEMGLEPPSPKRWKRLSNSSLPERPLALAAGLGVLGRNGLLIAQPRSGESKTPSSALLLGLLLCPVGLGETPRTRESPRDPCGECRRCLEACPTNALGGEGGGFTRELCRQNWMARDLEPPSAVEEKMGSILYGCDICLKACPHFRTDPEAETELGILGPRLPARFFLNEDEAEIKRRLSGSALGLSWMSVEGFRRCAARASRIQGSLT
jgi:epoxyqueuosine reductase QueG